jgi:hypothetical protein
MRRVALLPVDHEIRMRRYWQSRLVRVGAVLLLLGSGPLLLIILAAAVGLWPDPNPNPIGPGILAAFTFWPAVICLGIGAFRIKFRGGSNS